MGNHGRNQRHIVLVLAATGTNFSFEFRLDQIFVADGVELAKTLLAGVDGTHPGGQGEPAVVRIAIDGGDVLLQRLAVHRLHQVLVHQLGQTADVHGQHQIGRRELAFPFQTLVQPLFGKHHIDLDPGLLLELLDDGLDQLILTVRIDVYLLGGERRLGDKRGESQCQHLHFHHPFLVCVKSDNHFRLHSA